jgi:hypothetical protein
MKLGSLDESVTITVCVPDDGEQEDIYDLAFARAATSRGISVSFHSSFGRKEPTEGIDAMPLSLEQEPSVIVHAQDLA